MPPLLLKSKPAQPFFPFFFGYDRASGHCGRETGDQSARCESGTGFSPYQHGWISGQPCQTVKVASVGMAIHWVMVTCSSLNPCAPDTRREPFDASELYQTVSVQEMANARMSEGRLYNQGE